MEPQDRDAINRLSKSLRTIKIMLGLFLLTMLLNLAALGFIIFTVVTFTRDITNKVTTIQNSTTESLDIRSKLCDNPTLSNFLDGNSDICKTE